MRIRNWIALLGFVGTSVVGISISYVTYMWPIWLPQKGFFFDYAYPLQTVSNYSVMRISITNASPDEVSEDVQLTLHKKANAGALRDLIKVEPPLSLPFREEEDKVILYFGQFKCGTTRSYGILTPPGILNLPLDNLNIESAKRPAKLNRTDNHNGLNFMNIVGTVFMVIMASSAIAGCCFILSYRYIDLEGYRTSLLEALAATDVRIKERALQNKQRGRPERRGRATPPDSAP